MPERVQRRDDGVAVGERRLDAAVIGIANDHEHGIGVLRAQLLDQRGQPRHAAAHSDGGEGVRVRLVRIAVPHECLVRREVRVQIVKLQKLNGDVGLSRRGQRGDRLIIVVMIFMVITPSVLLIRCGLAPEDGQKFHEQRPSPQRARTTVVNHGVGGEVSRQRVAGVRLFAAFRRA